MSISKYYMQGLLGVSVVLCLGFHSKVSAQSDSIMEHIRANFINNIQHLSDLYFFDDPAGQTGTFRFSTNSNFQQSFSDSELSGFSDHSELASAYYNFLNALAPGYKQNLVRYFSGFEARMEESWAEAQLPSALKYLAPALSAMNPLATGHENRAGMWQLTHFQAVLNGLHISRLIDERFNERLATMAFVRTMQQNLQQYESAGLAALAYIYGNAKLNNALFEAGGEAEIQKVIGALPESAEHILALWQAAAIFFKLNRFRPEQEIWAKKTDPDTVTINHELHLQQISEVLQIPLNQLQSLNPQYKFMVVPGHQYPMKVAIPAGKWDDFIVWQDSIYNTYDSARFALTTQKIEYPPAPDRQYTGQPVKNLLIEGKTKLNYTLKTGDVLGIIAEKYDVAVADLKNWNNISNERRIQAGKSLDIFVDDDMADHYKALAAGSAEDDEKPPADDKVGQYIQQTTLPVFQELREQPKVEHVVKNGESPFTIAKKYKGVSPEQILEWNQISDARKIQIGQKLTIYLLK